MKRITKFVDKMKEQYTEYLKKRIIGAMTLISEETSFNERQQCLFQFLKTFPPSDFEEIDLLEYMKQAEFSEILEWHYLKKKDYKNGIIYAIQASHNNRDHCFSVIRSLLSDPTLSETEKESIRSYIINQLQNFIHVDEEGFNFYSFFFFFFFCFFFYIYIYFNFLFLFFIIFFLKNIATSLLIVDVFGKNDHNRLVQELAHSPEKQFQYLQGIMVARRKYLFFKIFFIFIFIFYLFLFFIFFYLFLFFYLFYIYFIFI